LIKNQELVYLLLLSFGLSGVPALADSIKGGVETNDVIQTPQQSYVPSYGAPKMIGVPVPVQHPLKPKEAPLKPKPKPKPIVPIQGAVTQVAPPPPLKASAAVSAPVTEGVLPPQFLGRWQVMGSRSGVEAQPQFQKGIDGIFAASTANTWTIQGSPQQGYMLSTDSGVSTPLTVVSQGNQAILKYQHPIRNTVAQEALVMQMTPGGVQFDGLERITIVKQGEPPRAKVTYKLIGHRQ